MMFTASVLAVPAGFCQKGQFFVVPCPLGPIQGPAGQSVFSTFVGTVISIALLVAASIAVIFLVLGAYRYITAHGNEEATEAAKKTMKASILGLVIIILASAIITIISRIVIEGSTGT